MIDSVASHNFLSELVASLKLPVVTAAEFRVCLGDVRRSATSEKCPNLTLSLGSCSVTADFYVFGLEGIDAILGVAWLHTSGDVKVNSLTLTMTFDWQGLTHTLQGDA